MTLSRLIITLVIVTAAVQAAGRDRVTETYDRHAGERLDGFEINNVEATLSERPMTGIEGLWQMTDDGARFAIVANDADELLIVMVDSDDRSILPGTVIGAVSPTSKRHIYDSRMMTDDRNPSKPSSAPVIMTLTDEGRLSLKTVRKGLRVKPWRMLPYMFRRAVTIVDDRPCDLDGALRLYPSSTTSRPVSPRYL